MSSPCDSKHDDIREVLDWPAFQNWMVTVNYTMLYPYFFKQDNGINLAVDALDQYANRLARYIAPSKKSAEEMKSLREYAFHITFTPHEMEKGPILPDEEIVDWSYMVDDLKQNDSFFHSFCLRDATKDEQSPIKLRSTKFERIEHAKM